MVLFVFREEYYLERSQPRENTEEHQKWQTAMDTVTGKADVIIGKQRHGPTGTVTLQFTPEFTRFSNLASRGAPAGAAGVRPARPPEVASSEREDGRATPRILTIDLDAAHRQLPAPCAISPPRPNAPPWSRPMPMVSAWRSPRPRSRARAARPSSWRRSARRAACARCSPTPSSMSLAGLVPARAETYRAHDLRPVLNSTKRSSAWAAFCKASRRETAGGDAHRQRHEPARALGRRGRCVAAARDRLDKLELSLVMSHLACADDPDHPKSEWQRQTFERRA